MRVLANQLAIQGVDFVSSEEIRDALKLVCGAALTQPLAVTTAGGAASGAPQPAARQPASPIHDGAVVEGISPSGRWLTIPPYQGDVLVRASEALGKTKDGHMTREVL